MDSVATDVAPAANSVTPASVPNGIGDDPISAAGLPAHDEAVFTDL